MSMMEAKYVVRVVTDFMLLLTGEPVMRGSSRGLWRGGWVGGRSLPLETIVTVAAGVGGHGHATAHGGPAAPGGCQGVGGDPSRPSPHGLA